MIRNQTQPVWGQQLETIGSEWQYRDPQGWGNIQFESEEDASDMEDYQPDYQHPDLTSHISHPTLLRMMSALGSRACYPLNTYRGCSRGPYLSGQNFQLNLVDDYGNEVIRDYRLEEPWREQLLTVSEAYEMVNDRADFIAGHYAQPGELFHCGYEICRGQRTSQLNGTHGEWTNGDDFAKKMVNTGLKERRKKQRKQVARGVVRAASSVAGAYIGDANVKLARMALATGSRGLKKQREGSQVTKLGLCASKLLQSYISPLSVEGVCIPKPPAQMSWKVRIIKRGVAYIGVNGFGYVAVAPTLVNDTPCLFTTKANSTSTKLTAPALNLNFSDTTLSTTNPENITLPTPYNTAHLNVVNADGYNRVVTGRICSATLSCQYAGKAVDQQGLMVGYVDMSGGRILGDQANYGAAGDTGNGYNMADLMSLLNADVEMNKGQMTIPIIPDSEEATEYPYDMLLTSDSQNTRRCYPYSSRVYYTDYANVAFPTPRLCGGAVACIAFTGTPGSSVYYEYVQHCEYVGANVSPIAATQTDIDLNGYTVVRDMLQKARSRAYTSNGETFRSCLKKVMAETKTVFSKEYRTK